MPVTKYEPNSHISFDRTKWKRQTAVGLELLAEAGNYAAVQMLQQNPYWACQPVAQAIFSQLSQISPRQNMPVSCVQRAPGFPFGPFQASPTTACNLGFDSPLRQTWLENCKFLQENLHSPSEPKQYNQQVIPFNSLAEENKGMQNVGEPSMQQCSPLNLAGQQNPFIKNPSISSPQASFPQTFAALKSLSLLANQQTTPTLSAIISLLSSVNSTLPQNPSNIFNNCNKPPELGEKNTLSELGPMSDAHQ